MLRIEVDYSINQYKNLLTEQIQYILDDRKNLVLPFVIYNNDKKIGFCIFLVENSLFGRKGAILQLSILSDDFDKNIFWKYLFEEIHPESINLLNSSSFLPIIKKYTNKELKIYSSVYLQKKLIYPVCLREDECIVKANKKMLNEIKNVWIEIFRYYKMENDYRTEDELLRVQKQLNNNDVYALVKDKRVIGYGVANMHYVMDRYIEIGFAIIPEHWRNGYGGKIASYLCYMCQTMQYMVVAQCNINNIASKKILLSIGFEKINDIINLAF